MGMILLLMIELFDHPVGMEDSGKRGSAAEMGTGFEGEFDAGGHILG